MALVRCKSCGIDTSDSLERCPICGGSPSGLGLASVVAPAAEASGRTAEGGDKAQAAARALSRISRQLRAVWIVAGLVLLAAMPHAFPILFVLAILWMFSRGRQASQKTRRSMQSEVLEVFRNQAASSRRAATDKPFARLRAIEQAMLERDA